MLVTHGYALTGGGLEVGLHQEYRRPEQRPGHARQRAAGGTPEWFSSKLLFAVMFFSSTNAKYISCTTE